jgi:hypothetical protein
MKPLDPWMLEAAQSAIENAKKLSVAAAGHSTKKTADALARVALEDAQRAYTLLGTAIREAAGGQ